MVALRWLRIALASIVATLLLTACAAAAASASAATVLIVNPSTIRAGFQVEVRATCGDNANPAFVSSKAFGDITLVPDHGILRADVTVPSNTRSGTYSVNLECASGQHSTAKLAVIDGGRPNPTHGPHTGGGQMGSTTGARLALTGGLAAVVAGAGLWLMSMTRRRAAARG